METMYIILLYWIIAICVTYLIRHQDGKKKNLIHLITMKTWARK